MNKNFTGIVIGLVIGLTITALPTVKADEVAVPVSQQGGSSIDKPKHSQSMQQISSRFGEPLQKFDAVGEPPITRWVYDEFTVYFEHDKVIHSVVHKQSGV
jgi:hypothetical protein